MELNALGVYTLLSLHSIIDQTIANTLVILFHGCNVRIAYKHNCNRISVRFCTRMSQTKHICMLFNNGVPQIRTKS